MHLFYRRCLEAMAEEQCDDPLQPSHKNDLLQTGQPRFVSLNRYCAQTDSVNQTIRLTMPVGLTTLCLFTGTFLTFLI